MIKNANSLDDKIPLDFSIPVCPVVEVVDIVAECDMPETPLREDACSLAKRDEKC